MGHHQKDQYIYIIDVPGKNWERRVRRIIQRNNGGKLSLAKERNRDPYSRIPESSNKIKPMRRAPRHIIIKLSKVKDKEKVLKAARGKQIII